MSSRRIAIFDTTLRDGEQSPGIALQPDEKVEIATQLERLGVDVIEAGFAASSPGEFDGVRAVARVARRATVATLCRTRREDIDAGAAALAGAARSRLHVFIATSPVHMEKKLGLEPEEVLEQAAWAVGYARELADEVEFSCEDATRSDPSFLARGLRRRRTRGRHDDQPARHRRLRAADRVRTPAPNVRRLCRELDRVTLSVHCHDDLGLAVANSLAGVAAGAGQVECTVNGIGERAGNAALEEVVMALRIRRDGLAAGTAVEPGEIGRASRSSNGSRATRCRRTRRSSGRTRSPTRPGSTRTAC